MPKTSIIDDTHPAIVYGGTEDARWKAYEDVYEHWTNEYNSTYHFTKTNGSNIAFSFRGTRITVHGTIDQPGKYGIPLSIYNIDDGPRAIFNETEEVPYANANETYSHVPLFRSAELPYGDHTILITASNVTSKSPFIFDYFTVEGVEDEDNGLGGGAFTVVDDVDESITYEGDWVGGSQPWDYAQTDHHSPKGVNGTATLSFSGTSIAVYARINNADVTAVPLAELILDEGISQRQQVSYYSTGGNFTWRNHLPLVVWNGLPSGPHTVKVVALGDRNPSWWLDYFVYGTEDGRQTALRGVVGSQSATSSDSPSPSSDVPLPPPSIIIPGGAIAGIIVGGILVLGLFAFLIYWFLWRRRRKGNDQQQQQQRGQSIRYHHSEPNVPVGVVSRDLPSPTSSPTIEARLDPFIAHDAANNPHRRLSIAKTRFSGFPLSLNGNRPPPPNGQTAPPT
ncbi:hypothetical protein FRC17_007084, partial [Serendipita sp. 399]